MNEEMPWVNLTQEEVEELRNKKHELTEYGKEKLRKLIYEQDMKKMKDAIDQKVLDLMKNQEPYPDAMFEEAERREALQDYKEAFGYLNTTEENKFRKIFPEKTKQAYNLIADYCMKEYNEKYGEISEDEYWRYMIADYSATGEGHTVCLMVTQATPYGDDYPKDGPDKYKALTTQEYRAVREFHQKFGSWYLQGIRFLPREEFYTTCAYYIPPVMMKLASAKCYKDFHTKVHYNFS